MNRDERQEAIAELSRTPDLLQQLILDVDEARLESAPPGEWSIRIVLAHLLSTEWQVFKVRLARMLTEDQPTVAVFDQEAWARQYLTEARESCSKIVTDFTIQRAASVRLLENVKTADWARSAIHPERGAITLDWMLEYWYHHDHDHLKQITDLIQMTDMAETSPENKE